MSNQTWSVYRLINIYTLRKDHYFFIQQINSFYRYSFTNFLLNGNILFRFQQWKIALYVVLDLVSRWLKYSSFIHFILCLAKWRLPSLSDLTPYWMSLELTHLGSEASKCIMSNDGLFGVSMVFEIVSIYFCTKLELFWGLRA